MYNTKWMYISIYRVISANKCHLHRTTSFCIHIKGTSTTIIEDNPMLVYIIQYWYTVRFCSYVLRLRCVQLHWLHHVSPQHICVCDNTIYDTCKYQCTYYTVYRIYLYIYHTFCYIICSHSDFTKYLKIFKWP